MRFSCCGGSTGENAVTATDVVQMKRRAADYAARIPLGSSNLALTVQQASPAQFRIPNEYLTCLTPEVMGLIARGAMFIPAQARAESENINSTSGITDAGREVLQAALCLSFLYSIAANPLTKGVAEPDPGVLPPAAFFVARLLMLVPAVYSHVEAKRAQWVPALAPILTAAAAEFAERRITVLPAVRDLLACAAQFRVKAVPGRHVMFPTTLVFQGTSSSYPEGATATRCLTAGPGVTDLPAMVASDGAEPATVSFATFSLVSTPIITPLSRSWFIGNLQDVAVARVVKPGAAALFKDAVEQKQPHPKSAFGGSQRGVYPSAPEDLPMDAGF